MALRILLVAQPTVAGVAVCVRQQAKAALEAGHEVTVACPAVGDLATWVHKDGATWVQLPLKRGPSIADVRWVVRLRGLLRQADVVHLHSSKAGAVGRLSLATLRRDAPASVFTPHGWSWLVGGHAQRLYRFFERKMAPFTDVIVAVSPETRQEGAAVLGAEGRRVIMIENGVDVDAFRPEGPVARRRPEPLLVVVGRFDRAKGQDLALEALAGLTHSQTRLRLVGTGAEEPRLRSLACRLGVAERVDWLGETDPRPHLRAADVVIVPSRWDALSLALLEAMACGSAIVATSVSGTQALSGSGVLVPPGDARQLASALDQLLRHPARRAELGRRARRAAVERYQLAASLDRTLALWDQLAAEKTSRRAARKPKAAPP